MHRAVGNIQSEQLQAEGRLSRIQMIFPAFQQKIDLFHRIRRGQITYRPQGLQQIFKHFDGTVFGSRHQEIFKIFFVHDQILISNCIDNTPLTHGRQFCGFNVAEAILHDLLIYHEL